MQLAHDLTNTDESQSDKYQNVLSQAKNVEGNNTTIETLIKMAETNKGFKTGNSIYNFHDKYFYPISLSISFLISTTLIYMWSNQFHNLSLEFLFLFTAIMVFFSVISLIINGVFHIHSKPRLHHTLSKIILKCINFDNPKNFNSEEKLANVFQFLRTVDNSNYSIKEHLNSGLHLTDDTGKIIKSFEESLRSDINKMGAQYGNIQYWVEHAAYCVSSVHEHNQHVQEIKSQNKPIQRLL